MTRNEAERIISMHGYNINTDRWFDGPNTDARFATMLEALGLIEFDEEKQIDSPSIVIQNELAQEFDNPVSYMIRADKVVNALYKAGYKIVRSKP